MKFHRQLLPFWSHVQLPTRQPTGGIGGMPHDRFCGRKIAARDSGVECIGVSAQVGAMLITVSAANKIRFIASPLNTRKGRRAVA
jgi:hypothetical protein